MAIQVWITCKRSYIPQYWQWSYTLIVHMAAVITFRKFASVTVCSSTSLLLYNSPGGLGQVPLRPQSMRAHKPSWNGRLHDFGKMARFTGKDLPNRCSEVHHLYALLDSHHGRGAMKLHDVPGIVGTAISCNQPLPPRSGHWRGREKHISCHVSPHRMSLETCQVDG